MIRDPAEGWPSGLRRTIANRVYGCKAVPRVQIPPSPPQSAARAPLRIDDPCILIFSDDPVTVHRSSCRDRAEVAQFVEHSPEKAGVDSSILSLGTIFHPFTVCSTRNGGTSATFLPLRIARINDSNQLTAARSRPSQLWM